MHEQMNSNKLLHVLFVVTAFSCTAVAQQEPQDREVRPDKLANSEKQLDQEQPAKEPSSDLEPLTTGPIHEAFATPVIYDPAPGMVVSAEPPPNVNEVPPDQKPSGENVVWVPGYWSWDTDRSDFVWVSGVWRAAPPDREWVPGYWERADQGWRWVSGYWKALEQRETAYLPPPPRSLEEGPSSEAPAGDCVWVPGCWVWLDGHYFWRPGYWIEARPRWVWSPAHYVWTPGGCVFVEGYWDYVPVRRGLIFAPVFFHRHVFTRSHFVYCPTIAIDVGLAFDSLFVLPVYRHYFFGDCFGPRWVAAGCIPAFRLHRSRIGFDPAWEHRAVFARRTDPHFEDHVRRRFEFLEKNPQARPPRTFAAQEHRQAASTRREGERAPPLGQPLAKLPRDGRLKIEPLGEERRRELGASSSSVRGFTRTRREAESSISRERRESAIRSRRLYAPAPKSPIVGRERSSVRVPRAPRPLRSGVQLRSQPRGRSPRSKD